MGCAYSVGVGNESVKFLVERVRAMSRLDIAMVLLLFLVPFSALVLLLLGS